MSTLASRVDRPPASWREALWAAAIAVGEGGRGAGFMACATIKGIVGMLQDEITGPSKGLGRIINGRYRQETNEQSLCL